MAISGRMTASLCSGDPADVSDPFAGNRDRPLDSLHVTETSTATHLTTVTQLASVQITTVAGTLTELGIVTKLETLTELKIVTKLGH